MATSLSVGAMVDVGFDEDGATLAELVAVLVLRCGRLPSGGLVGAFAAFLVVLLVVVDVFCF